MVAYSFQREFNQPIYDHTKIGTIRGFRAGNSRHARPGETVQLYNGLRTKYVHKLGIATCRKTLRILLDLREGVVFYPGDLETIKGNDEINRFAVRDGFKNWEKLVAFWEQKYRSIAVFEGAHIIWEETFLPAIGSA
jgi:hypothetical protein